MKNLVSADMHVYWLEYKIAEILFSPDFIMQVSNENLPKSMRYGLQSATAVQATTTLSRFASVNGTSFTPTGSNQVRIKIQAPGFLDLAKHSLSFKITAATAGLFVDTHAGSFFDRLRIEANGVVIEEINSYGLYNSIRKTYNRSFAHQWKDAVGAGSAQLEIKNQAADAGADDGKIVKAEVGSLGESIATNASAHFTIQLESGLFQNDHKKALPEGTVELDLILTLAANNQAVVAATGQAPTWTLSDPVVHCPSYRIDNGDVMASYRQVMQAEGMMISGITAKAYVNELAGAAGRKSLQINDRSLSCLGMVTALRDSGVDSVIDKYANGAYGFNDGTGNVTSYRYQIAGINYPASDVDVETAANGRNFGRVYHESVKALARAGELESDGNVSRHQLAGSILDVYASATDTASTEVPKGLISVDLRKFNDAMLRMSGLNTAANASPNVCEITTDALHGALSATTFSICEAFYQIMPNGSMSVAV
jgi:hypothetical protein